MRTMQNIPMALLKPPPNARTLKQSVVQQLADSIAIIGLQQPIIVRRGPVSERGLIKQGFIVVAGNHRYHAMQKLERDSIEAWVMGEDDSEINLELIEIDENLCRSEYTTAQRSKAIKRRKELWEALNDKLSGVPPSLGGRGNTEFATETSDASGMSKRSINEHVARAEALGPSIDDVVGTSLDTTRELDALAHMQPDERDELIAKAKAGQKVSARKPKKEETETGFFVPAFIETLEKMAAKFERDMRMSVEDAVLNLRKLIDPKDKQTIARLNNALLPFEAIQGAAVIISVKAA